MKSKKPSSSTTLDFVNFNGKNIFLLCKNKNT